MFHERHSGPVLTFNNQRKKQTEEDVYFLLPFSLEIMSLSLGNVYKTTIGVVLDKRNTVLSYLIYQCTTEQIPSVLTAHLHIMA